MALSEREETATIDPSRCVHTVSAFSFSRLDLLYTPTSLPVGFVDSLMARMMHAPERTTDTDPCHTLSLFISLDSTFCYLYTSLDFLFPPTLSDLGFHLLPLDDTTYVYVI